MKLNLLEEYLLLALDDEKGKFVIDSTRLNYGFAGASLLELAVRGKVEIDGERIILTDNAYEPEIALNKVIDVVSQLKSPTLKDCLKELAEKTGEIKDDTLQHLINKGILRREEHKILWIIPTEQYPTADLSPESKVRKRLDDVINDEANVEPHDLMLLSLIDATDLTQEAFRDQDDYKSIRAKIREVTKDVGISRVINKSIREIQAAIMMAISSTLVIGSISSH
ncbi:MULTISPECIES: GPP34 family phosphoprotein [Roseivirga]|uniref:GOLPH3/VPS74 family protein n=1 Tax=Roseivirga TaxID=290180 RepID=UPI00257ED43A|nr:MULTISPECIES: GPP34 family phosphoprotein [Roseivirga]MEC7755801.1 GPP34 family phosphoprotein [Bacteroidota bacterium]|tara:strand:- start:7665 stop:8339 length:675 start_codon:yes stop_codon:yes gene_type:complete